MCINLEIRGSQFESDNEDENGSRKKSSRPADPLAEYSLLSRQLHAIVGSDLFADVVFEVEGKHVAAHRNILVSRSEYFRAMLSEKSKFKEATLNAKIHDNHSLSPIYIGDITYTIFMQVLNFIYTGHIDSTNFPHNIAGKHLFFNLIYERNSAEIKYFMQLK